MLPGPFSDFSDGAWERGYCFSALPLVVELQCSSPHDGNVEIGREPTCQPGKGEKWEEDEEVGSKNSYSGIGQVLHLMHPHI